jgi:hypothetical protein
MSNACRVCHWSALFRELLGWIEHTPNRSKARFHVCILLFTYQTSFRFKKYLVLKSEFKMIELKRAS